MPFAPAPVLRFTRDGVPAAAPGEFVVNFDDILEHNLFVEGVTRSGKTNLVRVLVEQMYGQAQLIILDPEGEYATLRSGERPFLIAGRGRDVDVTPTAESVRWFVDQLVEKRVSIIFDLSGYEDEEQHTIVAAVCDTLVALPETHPGDILTIIEELQEFAPEGGGRGSALPSVRRYAKRGLKRGCALVGSSQRVADVAKGVITMLKSKAIGGTDNNDIPRALDELGIPRRDRKALADLAQGEFWVKGPAFARHATHVRAPLAQSSPPKRRRGEGAVTAAEAPAEIAALAAAIAERETAKRAEAEAAREAVEASTRRTCSTTTATAGGVDGRPDPADGATSAELEEAHAAGVASERARWNRVCGVLAQCARAARQQLAGVIAALGEVDGVIAGLAEEATQGCAATTIAPVLAAPVQRPPAPTHELSPAPAVRPKGAKARLPVAQRLVDALARLADAGIRHAPRAVVAVLAASSPTSSATERAFADLLRGGELTAPEPGVVALNGARPTAVTFADVPPTLFEYHERWRELLKPTPRTLLDAMIVRRGHDAVRADLAKAAALTFTSSATERAFATLLKLGLFEMAGPGKVRGAALLFPEGLS